MRDGINVLPLIPAISSGHKARPAALTNDNTAAAASSSSSPSRGAAFMNYQKCRNYCRHHTENICWPGVLQSILFSLLLILARLQDYNMGKLRRRFFPQNIRTPISRNPIWHTTAHTIVTYDTNKQAAINKCICYFKISSEFHWLWLKPVCAW